MPIKLGKMMASGFVEYANQAEKKVYFTDYANQADVKIFFVEYANQAKWVKKEKQHFFY